MEALLDSSVEVLVNYSVSVNAKEDLESLFLTVSNKGNFIENCPSPHPTELSPLPYDIAPLDILILTLQLQKKASIPEISGNYVPDPEKSATETHRAEVAHNKLQQEVGALRARDEARKKLAASNIFQKLFTSRPVERMLVAFTWFNLLHHFPGAKGIQLADANGAALKSAYLRHLAAAFVQLLMLSSERQFLDKRDLMMSFVPDLIAQASFLALCHAFPLSRRRFAAHPNFKKSLSLDMHFLMEGVEPHDVDVRHWFSLSVGAFLDVSEPFGNSALRDTFRAVAKRAGNAGLLAKGMTVKSTKKKPVKRSLLANMRMREGFAGLSDHLASQDAQDAVGADGSDGYQYDVMGSKAAHPVTSQHWHNFYGQEKRSSVMSPGWNPKADLPFAQPNSTALPVPRTIEGSKLLGKSMDARRRRRAKDALLFDDEHEDGALLETTVVAPAFCIAEAVGGRRLNLAEPVHRSDCTVNTPGAHAELSKGKLPYVMSSPKRTRLFDESAILQATKERFRPACATDPELQKLAVMQPSKVVTHGLSTKMIFRAAATAPLVTIHQRSCAAEINRVVASNSSSEGASNVIRRNFVELPREENELLPTTALDDHSPRDTGSLKAEGESGSVSLPRTPATAHTPRDTASSVENNEKPIPPVPAKAMTRPSTVSGTKRGDAEVGTFLRPHTALSRRLKEDASQALPDLWRIEEVDKRTAFSSLKLRCETPAHALPTDDLDDACSLRLSVAALAAALLERELSRQASTAKEPPIVIDFDILSAVPTLNITKESGSRAFLPPPSPMTQLVLQNVVNFDYAGPTPGVRAGTGGHFEWTDSPQQDSKPQPQADKPLPIERYIRLATPKRSFRSISHVPRSVEIETVTLTKATAAPCFNAPLGSTFETTNIDFDIMHGVADDALRAAQRILSEETGAARQLELMRRQVLFQSKRRDLVLFGAKVRTLSNQEKAHTSKVDMVLLQILSALEVASSPSEEDNTLQRVSALRAAIDMIDNNLSLFPRQFRALLVNWSVEQRPIVERLALQYKSEAAGVRLALLSGARQDTNEASGASSDHVHKKGRMETTPKDDTPLGRDHRLRRVAAQQRKLGREDPPSGPFDPPTLIKEIHRGEMRLKKWQRAGTGGVISSQRIADERQHMSMRLTPAEIAKNRTYFHQQEPAQGNLVETLLAKK